MRDRAMTWYQNLSLRLKITLMVLVCGVIPIVIISTSGLWYIRSIVMDKELYALNRSYDQTLQMVENLFEGMKDLSLQLSVNTLIEKAFSLKAQEVSIAEQLTIFKEVNSFTDSMMSGAKVDRVYYYTGEGYVTVQTGGARYRPLSDAADEEWYLQFVQNEENISWISFDDGVSYRNDNDYVGLVRGIWSNTDYQKRLCAVVVLGRKERVTDSLNGIYSDQVLWLQFPNGEILGGEGQDIPKQDMSVFQEYNEFTRAVLDGEIYYVRAGQVKGTGLYLYSLLAESEMLNMVYGGFSNIIAISVLVVIWLFIMTAIFSKIITRRLVELQEQMQKIQQLEVGHIRIPVYETPRYRDEIGQLVDHYNYMIIRLNELMETQYELGVEKNRIELQLLQSQINPHFLYNTLEMLGWMSKRGENKVINAVLRAMAQYYKLVLSRGEDTICIRDELEMCQAYMEIQNRRFQGKIRYEVEVQEEVMDCLIPKVTLQPFIENAIRHGILEKPDRRGVVMVNGWEEEGYIVLGVTDDGNGMDKEMMQHILQNDGHYGLRNVKKRLSLLFREEIAIHMESSPGIGTCVYIRIPKRRKENEI